jgi:hypothetical protein
VHVDPRDGHVETTSLTVYGDEALPEEQKVPCTMTAGDRQDKRPDLTPCVVATRCGDRAVPLGGTPAEGQTAAKTVQNPRLAPIATCLGQPGVAPGADLDGAEAALVTAAHLAVLGATRFITRFPATDNACGRRRAEAVARNAWEDVGVLAPPKPPQPRPAPAYTAAAGAVTRSGTAERAGVVHSSAPAKRRPQRLARDIQAADRTRHPTVRTAAPQEYCGRAEADAAAAPRRAVYPPDQRVDVTVEARPVYGRGRPSAPQPRPVNALR